MAEQSRKTETKEMPIKVRIPATLKKYTGNAAEVEGRGATVAECFDNLEEDFPGIKDAVLAGTGRPKGFVNVFVNEEDIRNLKGINTPLADGDSLWIVPAIVGG
jgi:molybdopterin synthase sulfur carrier subunit